MWVLWSGGGVSERSAGSRGAVSSAGAAYVCSRVWASGTLAAAAFTPVLVAILREGLSKSTEVVVKAVPVRGIVRSMKTTTALSTPSVKVERADGEIVKVPFTSIVEIINHNRVARDA